MFGQDVRLAKSLRFSECLLPCQVRHVNLLNLAVFPRFSMKHILVAERIQSEAELRSLKKAFKGVNLILSLSLGDKRPLTHCEFVPTKLKLHVLGQILSIAESVRCNGQRIGILYDHCFRIGFILYRFPIRNLEAYVVPFSGKKLNQFVSIGRQLVISDSGSDPKNTKNYNNFVHVRLFSMEIQSAQIVRHQLGADLSGSVCCCAEDRYAAGRTVQ